MVHTRSYTYFGSQFIVSYIVSGNDKLADAPTVDINEVADTAGIEASALENRMKVDELRLVTLFETAKLSRRRS